MIRKPNIKITYGRKTTEHYLHHERVLKKNIKKKEKEKKMQHRSFLQQEKNSGGMGVGMLFVTFQSKKNPKYHVTCKKKETPAGTCWSLEIIAVGSLQVAQLYANWNFN